LFAPPAHWESANRRWAPVLLAAVLAALSAIFVGNSASASTPADSLTAAAQRDVFFALERLIAATPDEGSQPARFVLNTVESIGGHDDVILITGVCSPVVGEADDA